MNQQHARPGRPILSLRLLSTTALLALGTSIVHAQDDREDWQPYFRKLAASYRIVPQAGSDEPFELHEPPVLRWSQPVRGGDDGALYVWLKNGEPAVVGTMFCWPHAEGYRVVVNEFHSLSTEPLRAERDGEEVWAPLEGGIEWTSFDETPPPAETATGRTLQLRRLSERFRGENVDDSAGKKWELRLLSQPLYRFDLSESAAPDAAVLDGGLFTLASGTDPEILILIAARLMDDAYQWQWALARFSDRPLTAWLDDEQVWTVERARPSPDKPHTYFDVAKLEHPPAVVE